MSLKELKVKLVGQDWKTEAYWALPIYWVIMILAGFFTVELKVRSGQSVRFSPHQISFHVKHNLNTFILVACSPDKGKVRLYPGSGILALENFGLKLEPLACGLEPSVRLLESL